MSEKNAGYTEYQEKKQRANELLTVKRNIDQVLHGAPSQNMLYLASQRIMKHWHARCQNWDLVLSQLELMFPQRAAG